MVQPGEMRTPDIAALPECWSSHLRRRILSKHCLPLKEKGAEILISPASWGPKPHGPEKSWEDRSRETGLPLFVCNRTGYDHSMSFADAESVVASGGKRLMTFRTFTSSVVLIDWDLSSQELIHHESSELHWKN